MRSRAPDVIYLGPRGAVGDPGSGEWKLGRIEYDHQAQAYVAVNGHPLLGIEAALIEGL
jgi:hypothetical protein